MARAKYKLGQLVSYQESEGQPQTLGEIQGVIHRSTGTTYEVAGNNDEITDDMIEAVFRRVLPRTTPKATKKTSKKTKLSSTSAAA